jgi:hypothetical protein
MANQAQAEVSSSLSGRDLELIKTLIAEVVKENRKPYVDEELEARKLKARTRLREERAEAQRNIDATQTACMHRREDGTSTVAWAENFHKARGLWIKEGPCQRCDKNFKPGVSGYEEMLMVPQGKMGIIG